MIFYCIQYDLHIWLENKRNIMNQNMILLMIYSHSLTEIFLEI